VAISAELAKKWLGVGWKTSAKIESYVKKTLEDRAKKKDRQEEEKTGIFADVMAVNPANSEEIPVWIVNYVMGDVGTGAIMGVPAHDFRDFEFAKKFNLPIRAAVVSKDAVMVLRGINEAHGTLPNKKDPHYKSIISGISRSLAQYPTVSEGVLINSNNFDDMPSEKAKWEITKAVGGKRVTQYRLRDWLLSRQRYWGPPIPMIYCETCAKSGKGERKEMPGWYAVPEKDLPVKLPLVKNFRPTGTGKSPLASAKSFYEVACPACKSKARRETDVSDTFLDSAWYYLRYPNVGESKQPWDPKVTEKWFPVSMYTGGAEHSVLHLLYVRFLALALHDLKLLKFGKSHSPEGEPFPKFRAHGLLVKEGAKMSKSKGNVVNPDE
jgi:leucyl-tRNA synthetase